MPSLGLFQVLEWVDVVRNQWKSEMYCTALKASKNFACAFLYCRQILLIEKAVPSQISEWVMQIKPSLHKAAIIVKIIVG